MLVCELYLSLLLHNYVCIYDCACVCYQTSTHLHSVIGTNFLKLWCTTVTEYLPQGHPKTPHIIGTRKFPLIDWFWSIPTMARWRIQSKILSCLHKSFSKIVYIFTTNMSSFCLDTSDHVWTMSSYQMLFWGLINLSYALTTSSITHHHNGRDAFLGSCTR